MSQYSLKQFLELETQVWAALVAGDLAADAALLSDNFLGVYTTGFSNRAEHAKQLEAGPIVANYKLSEAKIQVQAKGVVLLTYRADWVRANDQSKETMYVSSIWKLIDGVWKNSFSQDTPA